MLVLRRGNHVWATLIMKVLLAQLCACVTLIASADTVLAVTEASTSAPTAQGHAVRGPAFVSLPTVVGNQRSQQRVSSPSGGLNPRKLIDSSGRGLRYDGPQSRLREHRRPRTATSASSHRSSVGSRRRSASLPTSKALLGVPRQRRTRGTTIPLMSTSATSSAHDEFVTPVDDRERRNLELGASQFRDSTDSGMFGPSGGSSSSSSSIEFDGSSWIAALAGAVPALLGNSACASAAASVAASATSTASTAAAAVTDAATAMGEEVLSAGGSEMGARVDAPATISFGAIVVAFAFLQARIRSAIKARTARREYEDVVKAIEKQQLGGMADEEDVLRVEQRMSELVREEQEARMLDIFGIPFNLVVPDGGPGGGGSGNPPRNGRGQRTSPRTRSAGAIGGGGELGIREAMKEKEESDMRGRETREQEMTPGATLKVAALWLVLISQLWLLLVLWNDPMGPASSAFLKD